MEGARLKAWLAILLVVTSAALAAGENHFPQPVRVGALIGQKLIGPTESQPLLGTIEGVDQVASGALAVRVNTWSIQPLGHRSVDIPLDAVAFLGPQLALTGLTGAQLAALPTAPAPSPLGADQTIRVDLVKPFH